MISENKLKHSIGVARECAKIARQNGHHEEFCDACFVMGFLHDIGYENGDISEHPSVGTKMVQSFIDYPDALKAIKNHGTKYEYFTEFDRILNTADLQINHEGHEICVFERLRSIGERHGFDSEHYKHAVSMAESLDLV